MIPGWNRCDSQGLVFDAFHRSLRWNEDTASPQIIATQTAAHTR